MPESLLFEDVVVTVCLHPNQDIVASGCIDGNIFLYENFISVLLF